ncbi:hypothetical protein PR202_ga22131 [Eleusine coracana subsp. coracana]|uniref:Uncharacterized protein n=1 Tax=Eleusine coracana subsp. coracana TaxID=191504 RepID=A0AAV5D3F9_ELECO|nr:hypothetical protein PR202_ga22131 [Eleusine coracana subsp. coracana]
MISLTCSGAFGSMFRTGAHPAQPSISVHQKYSKILQVPSDRAAAARLRSARAPSLYTLQPPWDSDGRGPSRRGPALFVSVCGARISPVRPPPLLDLGRNQPNSAVGPAQHVPELELCRTTARENNRAARAAHAKTLLLGPKISQPAGRPPKLPPPAPSAPLLLLLPSP